jgi:hypothetical protein
MHARGEGVLTCCVVLCCVVIDAATLWGCTGGLRGSMDRELLGDTHLDQDPPVKYVTTLPIV